jgi:multidrug efflux system membrane fusion protein
MMKRYAMAAAFALAFAAPLAMGACGGKDKEVPAARKPVADVVTVAVAAEQRETFADLVGTVRARNVAAVAPQAMGRILSMPVVEGMRVARGATLATLDDAPLRAQFTSAQGTVAEANAAKEEVERAVAQAEAGRELAEKTYSRYAKLNEDRVITPQEFDEVGTRRTLAVKEHERAIEKRAQVAAKVVQAQGQLRAVEAQLSWSKVTAPFEGVVVGKKADAGGMAMPGVPLVVIEDTRSYLIEASVPETQLSAVRVGTRVEVTLDSAPGKAYPATVSEIVPSVDPGSRTFTVKAALSAPELRTGLFGRVRVPMGKAPVVTVPRSAVMNRGGFEALFVVANDNVARLVMVTTGAAYGDRIAILSGLDAGDRVAVSRIEQLSDGVPVRAAK